MNNTLFYKKYANDIFIEKITNEALLQKTQTNVKLTLSSKFISSSKHETIKKNGNVDIQNDKGKSIRT